MRSTQNLTDYELTALKGKFNLADGHARYDPDRYYNRVIEILSKSNAARTQKDGEVEFSNVFFKLAKQKISNWIDRTLFCPSASVSIELIANYLRLSRTTTSLIEPVFDNLADILKRHGVLTGALQENRLHEAGLLVCLDSLTTDGFFIVLPNNPTGYIINKETFIDLVNYCQKTNKLLILDFSFRFFCSDLLSWDQYDILENSGVRYIAIEDTGKTWSTFEIKASSITSDKTTFPILQKIYSDIFINLSPLILYVLSEFVRETDERGLNYIWQIVDRNRALLRSIVHNSYLVPRNLPNGSVDWLEITKNVPDIDLVTHFSDAGLHLLPGRHFFWNQSTNHSNFIRLALMRDFDYFSEAMEVFQQTLNSVEHESEEKSEK